MSDQHKACTKDDHESSCIHDWRARKEKIAHRFKLEDPKFDGYCNTNVFNH